MQFALSTRDERLAFVDASWADVGFHVRPLRNILFVRTEPPPEKIGSIYLPPKLQGFFGPLPKGTVVTAVVMSAGPKCEFEVGDVVGFIRTPFARFHDCKDGSKVGWIPEDQLLYGLTIQDPSSSAPGKTVYAATIDDANFFAL
jgi:hypothetical protein